MTMSILFYGVETWLLLRIMCGTKRLNAFSDYTGPVRYFRSAKSISCCFSWVRYGVKAGVAYTVATRNKAFRSGRFGLSRFGLVDSV